jgi:5-methylthioadenosine/S-adenosylhomocysteine deaminase
LGKGWSKLKGHRFVQGKIVGKAKLDSTIAIASGRIVDQDGPSNDFLDIDLTGSYAYPALINAHDHMRGNYLPRVGPAAGTFYENWGPWDADLKASPVYLERSNINDEQLYFLSAYKNLFSGVATVSDHFPHKLNDPFIPKMPIRVIKEYALAHECSSFELKWGDGIEIEHERAVKHNWPFITHLEEGFDAESTDGVGVVKRAKALDEHCFFIHCVGFSEQDIQEIKAAGASVCWCPASNMFMFNATMKIRKMLEAGVNVALGTDSTHTGSVNLFAEMRFARERYRAMYGRELSAKTLFEMVTINAAKALRIDSQTGSLEKGKKADILVLAAKDEDPFENLAKADMADVRLLVMDGIPLYGELPFLEKFGKLPGLSQVKVSGRDMFVKGNPAQLLANIRKAVGFDKKLGYLPFEA